MRKKNQKQNQADIKKNVKNHSEVKTDTEQTEVEEKTPKTGEVVTMVAPNQFLVGDKQYELIKNHRDAFDAERLGERFSDILARYDYIVGDWGYDQLRLKGFFKPETSKGSPEQKIDTLEDYLYEYCNFGCAYFVVERLDGEKDKPKRKKSNKKPKKSQAHMEEKKEPTKQKHAIRLSKQTDKPKKQTELNKKSDGHARSERKFTIRQREE